VIAVRCQTWKRPDSESKDAAEYQPLPSGDRTDLGTIEIFREACAFNPTHVACLDTTPIAEPPVAEESECLLG
jgi:hypothetical protein